MTTAIGVEASASASGNVRPQSHAQFRRLPTTDQLAELLAEGMAVPQAAERMGITSRYANAVMQRIRKGLGPQAV